MTTLYIFFFFIVRNQNMPPSLTHMSTVNKGGTFLSRARTFENATCQERASARSAFENYLIFTRHRISRNKIMLMLTAIIVAEVFHHDNPSFLQRRPLKLHWSHTPNPSLALLIFSLALPLLVAFPCSTERVAPGQGSWSPFILRPHHYQVLFCSPCWILISFTAAKGGGTDIPHTFMTDPPA